MKNHYILRHPAVLAPATILLTGVLACAPKGSSPNPETSAPKPAQEQSTKLPECTAIVATPDPANPRTIDFQLITAHDEVTGLYDIDYTKFNFGDGPEEQIPGITARHTYSNPGKYIVEASIVMNAQVGSGMKDGTSFPCDPPATVTVP